MRGDLSGKMPQVIEVFLDLPKIEPHDPTSRPSESTLPGAASVSETRDKRHVLMGKKPIERAIGFRRRQCIHGAAWIKLTFRAFVCQASGSAQDEAQQYDNEQ
jgi:hypothetical protein